MCHSRFNQIRPGIVVLVAVSVCATAPAVAVNHLRNGSFEEWQQGTPVGWSWFRKDGGQSDDPTPVGFEAANDEAYAGERCIRLWKKSPIERERYGMLFQDVKGLPAGAKLHFRAMVKGKDVGRTYWGVWNPVVHGRQGDFDWTQFSVSIQLAPDQTEIRFMIAMDAATESLWVDDLQLIIDGEEFATTKVSEKAKARTTAKPEYTIRGSFEKLSPGFIPRPSGRGRCGTRATRRSRSCVTRARAPTGSIRSASPRRHPLRQTLTGCSIRRSPGFRREAPSTTAR